MTELNKQALREAAVRAGGGKWIYIRTLSLSNAYITEETGATVINCTGGDVPAKCAGFLELSNPATVLALLDELEKTQKGEKQWREVVDAFCVDDADWHKLTTSNNELISFLSQALCKQVDRIAELEARTVTLPDVEKWRSVDAVRAQNAYKVLVSKVLADAGIGVKGE